MTAQIANVNVSTDSFGQWVTKTNQVITVISNTAVTTQSNTASGNAAITGWFAANTLTSSNTGSIRLGQGTANALANSTTFVIRSSSTANNRISSTGMVIDGVTSYTRTSMTIGNTTIMGANINANSVILNNRLTLGNTVLTASRIQGQTANVEEMNVIYDVSIGNSLANSYIDSEAVNVYYNNGSFTANSRMTATTLWIQNIFANTISTTGDLTFNSNTWFRGANNYFDNGLTAAKNSFFANITVSDTATLNKLDTSGVTTFSSNVTISGRLSANVVASSGGVTIVGNNNGVTTRRIVFVDPADNTSVTITANVATTPYSLRLPLADGSATQYLGTDGTGRLNFYTLSGNTTTDFSAKSIGVGNSVTPSGVNGEIRAAGNITAYYSSDERLKENINPIPNALDLVKSINGVEFDWNDEYIEKNGGEDGYFTRKHDIGVIAQEIEKVLPEVVGTRDDGYKAVKYERLVAVLIEAVKELSAEVDRLKNGH